MKNLRLSDETLRPILADAAKQLLGVHLPSHYEPQCEAVVNGEECARKATVEQTDHDEEGSYYTFRCDEHINTSTRYVTTEL